MMNNKNIKVFFIDTLVFVYVHEWLKMCWILTPFRPLHFIIHVFMNPHLKLKITILSTSWKHTTHCNVIWSSTTSILHHQAKKGQSLRRETILDTHLSYNSKKGHILFFQVI
jgi:hypothetical protein